MKAPDCFFYNQKSSVYKNWKIKAVFLNRKPGNHISYNLFISAFLK